MHSIDLNGAWRLRAAGDEKDYPATVPGDAMADLLSCGEIEDPYFRENENDLQWIGEKDWIYSRSFDVDEKILAEESIKLCCEGLDTLATVSINGTQIGEADPHRIEIRCAV